MAQNVEAQKDEIRNPCFFLTLGGAIRELFSLASPSSSFPPTNNLTHVTHPRFQAPASIRKSAQSGLCSNEAELTDKSESILLYWSTRAAFQDCFPGNQHRKYACKSKTTAH